MKLENYQVNNLSPEELKQIDGGDGWVCGFVGWTYEVQDAAGEFFEGFADGFHEGYVEDR
ncbi:MAG: hypothetical protein AAF149_22935 [Bacteroidota bacterium]